jgi:2'-5' RNA ligase
MDEASGARQRLFVAVPLPEALFGFVEKAQGLLPRFPGLRLAHREQFHVTLAFIGEVAAPEAEAARAAVESVPPSMGGEGLMRGFLFLPSAKKARVVALDIADSAGSFGRLFEEVMVGLESAGVMQREKRPFRPHLTVARLRTPGPVQPRSESGEALFAIESVCLYESELRREGAAYTVLARTVMK